MSTTLPNISTVPKNDNKELFCSRATNSQEFSFTAPIATFASPTVTKPFPANQCISICSPTMRQGKRQRELDDEGDNTGTLGDGGGYIENVNSRGMLVRGKGKGKEVVYERNGDGGFGNWMVHDMKRMRLELDSVEESSSSESNSSLPTPASYSPPRDSNTCFSQQQQHHPHYDFNTTSNQSPYAQLNQQPSHHVEPPRFQLYNYQQHQQQSQPNKIHPIRISTRSNASSSSSELRNPYDNINSLLYLAHLTRNSHVVNELEEDLGEMEIDEREFGNHEVRRKTGSGSSRVEASPSSLVSLPSITSEDVNNQGYYDRRLAGESSATAANYSNINSVLRDAFLRRRGGLNAN